jgi:hypothetical protein
VKNSFRAVFLFSAILFLTAGIASADPFITYQFTGGPVSASFELPVNPTVLSSNDGFNFIVMPINLMINGVSSSDGLDFFAAGMGGGGFSAFNGGPLADIGVTGPPLYTGSESSPTMAMLDAGGVALTDFMTGDFAGTLTTSSITSTPEPSSTVLLGVGFLAVGLAALRFKPRLTVTAN